MITATFFRHTPGLDLLGQLASALATGRGKTPYTAIRAAQRGLSPDHHNTGGKIGLHLYEGEDPLGEALITAFGAGAGEAASEARDMLRKAGAGGGR